MGARDKRHRTAARPVSSAVLMAALALAAVAGPSGCGSIYHEIARREPSGLEQRLDLRQDEAIRAHENALAAIERIVDDLSERRHARTRAGRIERMRDERIEAKRLAWRARKSIASIEDVIVLDTAGELAAEASDHSARQIALLERASDEIANALDLIEGAAESYEAGAPVDTESIGAHIGRARKLVDQSR